MLIVLLERGSSHGFVGKGGGFGGDVVTLSPSSQLASDSGLGITRLTEE